MTIRNLALPLRLLATVTPLLVLALPAQSPGPSALPASTTNRGALEARLRVLDTRASRTDSAAPHYDLAVEFFALHKAGAPVLASDGAREGESHVESGWRQLAEALERDPAYLPARALATHLLVARGERLPRNDESKGLAALRARFPEDPDLLLVAGREARAKGSLAEAAALFARARSASTAPRGDLDLEIARTARGMNDSLAAVQEYFAGLQHLSHESRLLYRLDFGLLMSADSLAEFDSIPDTGLGDWARRFWSKRDAETASLPGSRLLEHMRRWLVVHRDFLIAQPWRRTQFKRVEFVFEGLVPCIKSVPELYELLARVVPVHPDDVRNREPLFDHRGVIYLRHGTPIRVVAGRGSGFPDLFPDFTALGNPEVSAIKKGLAAKMDQSMAANASWLYWFDGDYRVLNFRGSDALGQSAPTTLSSFLPVQNDMHDKYTWDWQDRGSMTAGYAAAAAAIRSRADPICLGPVQAMIKESRQTASLSIQTDSDSPLVREPWNAVIQSLGVGAANGIPGRTLVAYAIPIAAMQPDTAADGAIRWSATFRVSAYNTATGVRSDLDTTIHVASRGAVGRTDYISGLLQLPLAPGTWQVAVLGRDGAGANRAYAVDHSVPVAAGDVLGVSDLVLGRPGGAPQWRGRGEPVPVNPLGTWPASTPVEVYAEVYGVASGEGYTVELTAELVGDARKRDIKLSNREVSTGMPSRVRRSLDVSKLPAGRYRLQLKVANGGATVQAEREIVVLKTISR